MARREVALIAVVWLVMLVMLQQSARTIAEDGIDDNFSICYAKCFVPCAITPVPISTCVSRCMAKCFFATSLNRNDYYCHLGCATSKCSNVVTRDNLDGEALESCAKSCSVGCKRH